MHFARAILLMAAGLIVAGSAWAHGGEEHGGGPPRQQEILPAGLGHGAAGDWSEAVVTPAEDQSTTIYLSDAMSNAPVEKALIEVEAAGNVPWTGQGESTPVAGVYRLAWVHLAPEAVDLTLTVAAGDRTDLILIQIPAMLHHDATPSPETSSRHLPEAGVTLALIVLLGGWWLRRKRKAVAMVTVLALFLNAAGSHAHGGEDHAAPAAQVVRGGRQVFLPKASQFLLDLRTVPAESREVAETIRLVGRVIPDPAAHARIHSPLPARVGYDPDFPPPTSGQWVKRGQTLAVLDPILSVTEKAGQRLTLSRGEQSEATVGREMVLAPIDGQLTDVHIIPGEVVTEGVGLAEIIDPARLWVEAILHDPLLADRISGATAATRQIPDRSFPLRLMGVSPKVNPENQGLHIQFAVRESLGLLKPGMPVDVYAQTGALSFAVAIPRAAVLDQGGIPLVWVKSAPEGFAGRPVRLGRRTAEWVEILEGIHPGDKVVFQGHNQLHALR